MTISSIVLTVSPVTVDPFPGALSASECLQRCEVFDPCGGGLATKLRERARCVAAPSRMGRGWLEAARIIMRNYQP